MINVSIEDTGLIIDGSHVNSVDFTIAVIELAINYGFGEQIDIKKFETDKAIFNARAADIDMHEALDFLYYDALEYLNDHVVDGFWFDVDDQCLYLSHESQVNELVY